MTRCRPHYGPRLMRDPTDGDPAVVIDGRKLIRIDGIWCARTRGGIWRPAHWLGSVTLHQLLEHIHANQPRPQRSRAAHPGAGQLQLLTA